VPALIVEHAETLGLPSKQMLTSPIEQLGTDRHRSVQSSSEQVQLLRSFEKQHFRVPVGSGQVVTTSPWTMPVIVKDAPQEQKPIVASFRQM